jgi:hypothetical protein
MFILSALSFKERRNSEYVGVETPEYGMCLWMKPKVTDDV